MSSAVDPTPSPFLTPPPAQIPLVLLPVRLETRIESLPGSKTELWLRVYPDDLHVNTFDPTLNIAEQMARTSYLASPADVETRRGTFAALAQQFGPERAAWITSADRAAATLPTVYNKAPFTNVLPERWIVLGYPGDGSRQILTVGPAIADSIAVGPIIDANNKLNTDDSQWVSDFDAAIKVGMAFRIPLTLQLSFKRIVVLGLKTGLNPQDSAARLADLLEAHHYTDGLELLSNNTPTNNTEAATSGFTTKDTDYATLFGQEQGPALCPTGPTRDGDRLALALGIAPKTLAHVSGADGRQDELAQAMNTVLWPATWGYYLGQMVSGAVTNPDVLIPAARDHFEGHVRARGHFPTLRIGNQPYGILPVCWSASWKPLEGRPLDVPLNGLLTQLRAIWQRYVAGVPRIPKAADPEAALVELLGMVPSTESTVARNVIGPEYSFMFWNFVKQNLKPVWWSTLKASVQENNSNLAVEMADTRLAQMTYTTWHRDLADVWVAPDPLDDKSTPAFISSLITLETWENFRDATYNVAGAPTPMLFLLLRHAALREYMDTALDLLSAANAVPPSERIEPEIVSFAAITTPRPSAWALLSNTLTGHGPVGSYLDGARTDATLPTFAGYWKAFAQLGGFSEQDLDAGAREVFDLSSYRLDAWITSFAHLRLDQTRTANPSGGIVLGAYGWIEDIGLWPDAPASSGYVHAPSLNQSTTAAILRSGYLSHQGGPGKPFEIDLSSARVRLALHLLDGIREGQSLGALLGYRLERTLQDLTPADGDLFRLINTLRQSYPLEGGGASQLDVVDGLALFRKATDIITFAKAATASEPLQAALLSALQMLQDAIDSVADLTLTESVHQLIRGNTIRAGATLDSIARGDTPPLDIDFVKTPRSGTALTYRLMTVAIGDSAPGWAITPRAQAEPRLNAWAAFLLGDPAKIRIRARFVDEGGKPPQSVEIGLNQLGLAPMDFVCFPETDGIKGEIASRILRIVEQARPATVPASSSIEIVPARDPAWPAQTVGLSEWIGLLNAVTRVIGASRPIEATDLTVQGTAPATANAEDQDLDKRVVAAKSQLDAALTALKNPGQAEVALLQAASLGVAGAYPGLDPSAWSMQITAAEAELTARSMALTKIAPDSPQAQDIARLKAIFGASFVVLPVLDAASTAAWPQLWKNSAMLQGGDTLASIRWLQRASRVRGGAGLMDTALMYAEALAGHPVLALDVAQLPANETDRWVALEGDGPASSTLSLVAFCPMLASEGAAIAGLMIDEWIEVWPSRDPKTGVANQQTGVTFQYADPIARAPQAILLAVRPDDTPFWTLESVEGSVLEALDLAKIRGVDPDVLFGDAPPIPLAGNVETFQTVSDPKAFMLDTELKAAYVSVFVLDTANVLWQNHGSIGDPPLTQLPVDTSVSSFQALSDTVVIVLKTDHTLWLERGPFGPSTTRQAMETNVTLTPTLPPPVVVPPPIVVPPPQVKVPALVNFTQVEVNRALAGTTLTVSYKLPLPPVNPRLEAIVESQDPAAGTFVPQHTNIKLTLADMSAK